MKSAGADAAAKSPGMAAWANECAGWLALGAAEESRGIYEIGRFDEFIWARPVPGKGMPRLPVMLLVERAIGTEADRIAETNAEGDLADDRGKTGADRLSRDGGDDAKGGRRYDPLDRLRTAVQTFGLRDTPLYLALPPEGHGDAWRDAARALNFRHESVQLLMSCSLPRSMHVATPARFDVRESHSDGEWNEGLDVIGDVYGDPRGMTAFYNPRGKVRLFVARLNEEPAAVAALWPFAGVAGIYSVATRERYRGLGLAYAVVEHVLNAALEEGFPLATLRTTGDLLAVYLRHGFSAAGQVQRYRLDM